MQWFTSLQFTFLLTINKAEIIREENIKADTCNTVLKRSIAKNKAAGTSKWQKIYQCPVKCQNSK